MKKFSSTELGGAREPPGDGVVAGTSLGSPQDLAYGTMGRLPGVRHKHARKRPERGMFIEKSPNQWDVADGASETLVAVPCRGLRCIRDR
jgi:hypothetical protein